MDTAVARPLNTNLHSFACELIRGGGDRFDPCGKTVWFRSLKGLLGREGGDLYILKSKYKAF